MRTWSSGGGRLLGVLLRNTYGWDRGAAGTDPGVHTLEYALGPAAASPVATGDALRTALNVTNPLVAAVAGPNRPTEGVSLPPQAALAAVTPAASTQPPAGILRAARTQPGSSVVPLPAPPTRCAERRSFILRVYLPDPASAKDGVSITLPSLPDPDPAIPYDPDLAAVVVSALEETVANAPALAVSGKTVSFSPDRALTTLQLTATRCPTQPNDGKDEGPGLSTPAPPGPGAR